MTTADKAKQVDTFFSKLGISLSSLLTAEKAIQLNRKNKRNIICLVGEAGIGKSQLVRQIAKKRTPAKPFRWNGELWETSVPVYTMYLAHIQAEDVGGVPYPSHAKRNELLNECDLYLRISEKAARINEAFSQKAQDHAFAIAESVLENGSPFQNGTFEYLLEKNLKHLPPEGILFLDEWNRADKTVIKAFFTILEDRKVHGVPLVPDNVQIVAAMNPSEGAYSVNEAEKDHAFRRRLCFVAVTTNEGAWLQYAGDETRGNFHPHVVNYIKSMPAHLYDTKLRDAGKAFPCPANWEKVSDLLKGAQEADISFDAPEVAAAIEGHIGIDIGSTFWGYIKDNQTVIAPNEVLEGYKEKSKVRRKVQAMIEAARNDILNELCTGVALVLMTEQPEAKKIAPHFAQFLGDLEPEMATALIVQKLPAAAKGADGADNYSHVLSAELHKYPTYSGLFQRVGDAMRKGHSEIEGTQSPLS